MSKQYPFVNEALDRRRNEQQYRSLVPLDAGGDPAESIQDGERFVNFSSNDYLGLSSHPSVIRTAAQYAEKYGAGSTASRLVTGNLNIHEKLEEHLAAFLNREAALLFNSGYQANSSILGTITDRHSLILADKLSHSSLLQGALASRAEFKRFRHNDLEHLKQLLKRAENDGYSRTWIVTESVFSMDGDRSPVSDIAELADSYGAYLFVDDAHAVGVWGKEGKGLAAEIQGTDILLGTCGKAFGSFGAYAACSQKMREYLINFCPGFIYTTALPPSVIGATHAALQLLPELEEERAQYHKRIESFRHTLQQLGYDTGPSTTQIIPVIIGDEKETVELAGWLKEHGFKITAIRPPTVPDGSSRLRITLSGRHTDKQLESIIKALKHWKNE